MSEIANIDQRVSLTEKGKFRFSLILSDSFSYYAEKINP